MRPKIGLAILLLAVSGCASVVAPQAQPMPAIAPGANGPAIDMPMFPECQAAAEFAFAGEATLAALGLAEMAGGPDATRPGMIWVTAGPVAFGPPEGKGFEEMPAQRMVCVQWPDGSGMSTTIPDEWELPSDIGEATTASATASSEPLDLGPIAVLVAVIVLVGASILAFRGDGRRSAGESAAT